ncbi:hypothetical protein KKB18_08405, partial [bacterium]|nr:hypothetical protein [bacterium]
TTQTETPTPTLTQTSSFTLTATPTQTQSSTQTSTIIETLTQTLTATPTPTITQTPSQTITMTPTLTATSTATQTQTLTATPTLTATETSTQTLTSSQSNTSTQTPTITETPSNTATPTITWFDFSPSLDYGNVLPERGNPNTTFEYLVHFCDPDGGYAPLTRIYINNGIYKTMHLKTGISCDGWYYFLLPGTALNIGNNEYYFLFIDNEGNSVRLPTSGNFMGPLVEIIENPTATQTPTQTLTVTPSPTESPIPDDCLVITSPIDFYCNSVLISWTPILNASYYTLEYDLHGELYSARMTENFVRINLPYQDDWKQYVDVGAVPYRVTAYDNIDRIIDGPTAWSHLVCQPDYVFPTIGVVNVTAALGCLRISNPQEFYYNTILLSWTPITGADHYLLEYKYKGEIYNVDLYSNWLRSIISDKEEWNLFTSFVAIEYRVSAVDSRGNIIDGPTPWMSFTCY